MLSRIRIIIYLFNVHMSVVCVCMTTLKKFPPKLSGNVSLQYLISGVCLITLLVELTNKTGPTFLYHTLKPFDLVNSLFDVTKIMLFDLKVVIAISHY